MPPPGSDEKEEVVDDGAMIGVIGPPRPLGGDGDDDGPIIGPPRPPPGPAESDSDDDIDGEPEDDQYRIPMSNEIVLKGHTKIYDRDGLTLGEFVKGDMYIRDVKNTKGHISGLTCGEWHPKSKETILTSSEDDSLRIWDVNDFKSQKQARKSSGNHVYLGL